MQNDKTKEQAPEIVIHADESKGLADGGKDAAEALQGIISTAAGDKPKKRPRFEEMKPAKRESFFRSIPFRFGAVMLATVMLFCLFYSAARAQGLSIYSMGLYAGGAMIQNVPFMHFTNRVAYPYQFAAFDQDRYDNLIALSKASWQDSHTLYPGDRFLLSYAYSQMGDFKKAVEYQKFADYPKPTYTYQQVSNAQGEMYTALLQEQMGDFKNALERYQSAQKQLDAIKSGYYSNRQFYIFPHLQWSHQEWGNFHPVSAGQYVLPSVDRHGYRADLLVNNNIAHCFVELRDPASAIEYANKALASDGKCVPAYKNKALAELQLGQLDKALADANSALELDKNYVAGLMARSQIYDRMGDKNKSDADRQHADRLKIQISGAAS